MPGNKLLDPNFCQVKLVPPRAECMPSEVSVPVPVHVGAVILLECNAPTIGSVATAGNLWIVKHDW